ncbi:hypothetical protein [Paenibacillus spongiae]|uniref:Uncharacterized protein n=1 Tax=Paenibacillus spongiae TaxID=2909671 RepID=A0ABY5SAK1_9BACL|nr:hypothetical protein [Paenibacillus spongiae]UVI30533.1 hypothetical protein L1F29_01175 [Paenibacillus spongiae]
MGRWRNSLEERWNEWVQVEDAVSLTLAGRSVLRVAGARTPRLLTPASKAVRITELNRVDGKYEAGLACFCLGEMPVEERPVFLAAWHERLGAGATAVLADRRSEGCESAMELHEMFAPVAAQLDVQVGRTFWWVRYRVRGE